MRAYVCACDPVCVLFFCMCLCSNICCIVILCAEVSLHNRAGCRERDGGGGQRVNVRCQQGIQVDQCE